MSAAIVWSIALVITIISASLGNKPIWAQVFIPLAVCVIRAWHVALF